MSRGVVEVCKSIHCLAKVEIPMLLGLRSLYQGQWQVANSRAAGRHHCVIKEVLHRLEGVHVCPCGTEADIEGIASVRDVARLLCAEAFDRLGTEKNRICKLRDWPSFIEILMQQFPHHSLAFHFGASLFPRIWICVARFR